MQVHYSYHRIQYSTWTAEQTDDLKFNMKICRFDTSKVPTLVFENDALPTAKLQNNPIETVSGQDFVKVYSYSHGMYDTKSNVSISGAVGNKTGSVTNITNPSTVTSGAETLAGTYQSGATSSSFVGSGATFEITTTGSSGSEAVSSVQITTVSGYVANEVMVITNFVCNKYIRDNSRCSRRFNWWISYFINQSELVYGTSSVIDNIEISSL